MEQFEATKFTERDLDLFAKFGITPELVIASSIERVTDSEAREKYGMKWTGDLSGLLFPYFLPTSNGHYVWARIRRDFPELDAAGREENKYVGVPGRHHLYFPLGAQELLADKSVPVCFVESEKAALALTAWAQRTNVKMIFIATGGVWGWRGTTGKTVNAKGKRVDETGPLSDLEFFRGHPAVILFDSNLASRDDLKVARDAFRSVLVRQNCPVQLLDLPASEGVNGPDDFLAIKGDAAVRELLNSAPVTRAHNPADWPEPQPLGAELPSVEVFDVAWLPASLQPLVDDISERMQTPPDYAAVNMIVALAGCVNRRAVIQPKLQDTGWSVVPNLWGAIVAPPGFLKSPIQRAVTMPLARIEEFWRQEYEGEMENFKTAKEEAELRHQAWKEQYKAAMKKGEPVPVQPDRTLREPTQKRLLLSDATFERLHEIMAENPAGVLVVRDELTGWLADLDKQGRESERGFYLTAWNGDSSFTVDRIGRGLVHVPSVCVSLLGNVQPARLRWFLSDAVRGGPGDDGLFQRFQLLVWPDPPRSWKLVDRPPNATAMTAIDKACRALVALSVDCPVGLRFSMEAQEFFFNWWTELEGKIRGESGLHPTTIAHLSKYRSLLPTIAGLFELTDVAASERPFDDSLFIDVRHAQNAAALCAYLESHARRVYSCLVAPELEAAHELARHIRHGDVASEFTMRTIYRKCWARLDSPERVQAVLAILEDANWVRPKRSSATGGRPSETWELNPLVRKE